LVQSGRVQYAKWQNTYEYPHQCVSNSDRKFGHVASMHRIHSMTFLTVDQQENQANLHRDLLQEDEADMKLIITRDEMWLYLYHITHSTSLTMEVRIIPRTEKSTIQHIECEEHTDCFLKLSRWDASGVCS
jgi:hypothetical protein